MKQYLLLYKTATCTVEKCVEIDGHNLENAKLLSCAFLGGVSKIKGMLVSSRLVYNYCEVDPRETSPKYVTDKQLDDKIAEVMKQIDDKLNKNKGVIK